MTWLWGLPALISAAYWIVALVAGVLRKRTSIGPFRPPVSILKAIHGRDPRFYDAIRTHATQDYPEFEILFGLTDPAEPALADIERLQREFPAITMRVIHTQTSAANGKVGVLAALVKEARHSILLINDSDIAVPPGYLAEVLAPLADKGIGVVTCLYRASADAFPARWEALGIATEFAPSVLVAPLVGVAGFALGSTMALRAADLERIGGFEAIEEYLADDYQLGARISRLGMRVLLSHVVVETHLGGETWTDVWRHQVRWSRTIRVSRTAGYFGYLVTQASFWSLAALLAGQWWAAGVAAGTRVAAGLFIGLSVLRDANVRRQWYLIPFRDLWGCAVWVAGCFGNTIVWRGKQFRLNSDGRIRPAD